MIQAQQVGIPTAERALPQTRHVSPHAFWLLFAVEAAFVAAILSVVLGTAFPDRAPLASSADYLTVRDAIWSRLNGAVADPMLQVVPGVTVRESSVRGFTLNGQTYYYYVEGRRGYDPLSRGAVDQAAIEVLLRDDGGPSHLVIYRLIP